MHNVNYPLPDVRYLASGSKLKKFQDGGYYSFRDYKKAAWDDEISREQKQYDRLYAKAQVHNTAGDPIGARANERLKSITNSNPNISSPTNKELMSKVNTMNTGASKVGGFMSSPAGGLISGAADVVAGAINTQSKVDTNPTQQMAKNAIIKGISMIPGYGTAIAAAVKVADAIGNATGTNLDALNKTQAKAAGISGWARVGNNIMGALPANFLGLATGDTMDAYNTKDVKELSNAFAGTGMDVDTAGTMGGKSYLFGKRKANDFIMEQNRNVDTLTSLNQTNSLRKNATGEQFDMQNQNIYAGKSMASNRNYVGKQGLKLITREEAARIAANRVQENVEKFKDGGVIGVDTNILPEGALHRNLNHLEEANPEVGEEVTLKGIPVIVTDENCEIDQVAEIEKEEIIFRKELTEKIEAFWKDGSEEAMILAGKLIAKEIISNTQDNTGQIEELNEQE